MKTKEYYLAIDGEKRIDEILNDHQADLALIDTSLNPEVFVNKIIAEVRKANRLWNEIALVSLGYYQDGLKKVMKEALMESDMPERMKRAAAYL